MTLSKITNIIYFFQKLLFTVLKIIPSNCNKTIFEFCEKKLSKLQSKTEVPKKEVLSPDVFA
jgi:hypothetical protein